MSSHDGGASSLPRLGMRLPDRMLMRGGLPDAVLPHQAGDASGLWHGEPIEPERVGRRTGGPCPRRSPWHVDDVDGVEGALPRADAAAYAEDLVDDGIALGVGELDHLLAHELRRAELLAFVPALLEIAGISFQYGYSMLQRKSPRLGDVIRRNRIETARQRHSRRFDGLRVVMDDIRVCRLAQPRAEVRRRYLRTWARLISQAIHMHVGLVKKEPFHGTT